jgi:tetratricopeptide (TPR) repeat protein
MYDQAIYEFRQAVKLSPDYTEAYVNLGTALGQKEMYFAGAAAFSKAIHIDRRLGIAHYNLGAVLHYLTLNEDALWELRQVLKLTDKGPVAEMARSLLQQIEQEGFWDVPGEKVYLSLAAAYEELDLLAEAEAVAKKGMGYYRDSWTLQLQYGLILTSRGEFAGAIDAYRAALEKSTEPWMVHINIGNAYDRLGQYDTAVSHYRDALKLDPGNQDALYNLALAYAHQGSSSDAVKTYRTLLNFYPEHQKALINLGQVFFDSGKNEEAISTWQEAISVDPFARVAEVARKNIRFVRTKGDNSP